MIFMIFYFLSSSDLTDGSDVRVRRAQISCENFSIVFALFSIE
jgi:hypothetical protein